MRKQFECEAIEALRGTLQQISVIKVKEIAIDRHGHRGETILCHVEIYRHAHLLACKVVSSCEMSRVKRVVDELKAIERERGVVVLPILIAPTLTEEAQALCRDKNVGFLDLDGNARLYLDEVFIVKRSLHREGRTVKPGIPGADRSTHFAHVA